MNSLDPKYHTDQSVARLLKSGLDGPWFRKKLGDLPPERQRQVFGRFADAYAGRVGKDDLWKKATKTESRKGQKKKAKAKKKG